MFYLSPGTRHPLRGRAALQVTADPGGGPAMFWTLGLWQRVATLPTLTQNHAVPVARATAGGALQREKEREKTSGRKAERGSQAKVQQAAACKTATLSAEGSSCTGNKAEKLASSCKTAGHNSCHGYIT